MKPVTPSAEVLLEHAEFLRRLARGILHDEDAADDVAQDAVLEAMQGRPRNPRGWLGTVARRLALSRRRAELRRAAREQAAARPEALPSTAEAVARLELQRRVVDAVLALEEPYRSVVVHRFFYDLTPSEVAKRLGLPVETVHTQLRRALGKLRARLDESHGHKAWSMALLAIAAPRKLPLGGLVAMSAKSKLVIASVLVLACAAVLVSALPRHHAETPRATAPPRHDASAEPEAAVTPPNPPSVPVDFASIDRDRDVHGVVVDPADNPIADADVRVIRYAAARDWALAELEAEEGPGTRTAADGSFALRVDRGEEVELRVRSKGFVTLERRWCPAGGKVRVVMREGVSLRIRALDPGGRSLSDVHVVAFKGRDAEVEAAGLRYFLEGVTNGQGICVLADLLPKRDVQFVAWHPEFAFPQPAGARLPDTGETGVEIRAEPGRAISGRVTDAATGAPVVGAIVNAYPVVIPFANAVRTDTDGRFRYGGWGSEHDLYVHAKGYATARGEAGDQDAIDFALKPGVTVTGVVRDVSGAAIERALVGTRSMDRKEIVEAWTDAQGKFELPDLAPGPHTLIAMKRGYARVSMPIEGTAVEVVLPEGRRLEGRVLGPEDQPVTGCEVALRELVAARAGDLAQTKGACYERHTDDLGRFRFADLPMGSWTLSATSGERDASRELRISDADLLDVDLRFDAPAAESGREYTVRVVDEANRPAPGVYVRSVHQPKGGVTDAEGRVTLQMKEGVDEDHVVVSKLDDRFVEPLSANYRPGQGEVRIVLREAVPVSGTVVLEGRPLAQAILHTRGPDWYGKIVVTDKAGKFTVRVPARTRVELSLTGQVGSEDVQPIYGGLKDVAAGSEGLLLEARRVAVDRALVVRVVAPDGSGVPGVTVFPLDARGWRRANKEEPKTDAAGRIEFSGLPAAELNLRIFSMPPKPWAQAKPNEIRVLPAGQEVVFTLREAKPVSGVISKADGTPVHTGVGAWRGNEQVAFAVSAEDGTFVLYVAADEPEPVRLSAAEGKTAGEVDGVLPGTSGVVIRLRAK